MHAPPPLEIGDTIHIVAPSGPFDRTLFWRGLGVLASRYRLRFDPDICARRGFLAGSDSRRRHELTRALSDPSTRAVLAARGGYGLTRVLPGIAASSLLDAPKWLVGFSDFTALHLECSRLGLMSLHAANVTGLGRGDSRARQSYLEALTVPLRSRTLTGVAASNGLARGPLVGGNLTLIHTVAASGRLRLPTGCILALEEVAETSYHLDRMLEALVSAGHFDRVAGFAIGELTDCSGGRFAVPAADVVRQQLRRLRVPIVEALPFGHGRVNSPLTFGAIALLDGRNGTLTIADRPGIQTEYPGHTPSPRLRY